MRKEWRSGREGGWGLGREGGEVDEVSGVGDMLRSQSEMTGECSIADVESRMGSKGMRYI